MSFGKNLQFLRKMHNSMTQEELAERMGVSRQTISKWESETAYPEMEKAFELCQFFSCSMDRLFRENMNMENEAYSPVRIEELEAFRMVRYVVISHDPETDALNHMKRWAEENGISGSWGHVNRIIGWDFPYLSQEQVNVFHMHGYAAACILPEDFTPSCKDMEAVAQEKEKYAVITITEPFNNPFELIPNAYKTIMSYMEVNGIKHKPDGKCLPCFESEYEKAGVSYMDIYVTVDMN